MRSVEASDRLAQPFGRLDVKGLREIGIKPQKALVVGSLLWSPASKLGHRDHGCRSFQQSNRDSNQLTRLRLRDPNTHIPGLRIWDFRVRG